MTFPLQILSHSTVPAHATSSAAAYCGHLCLLHKQSLGSHKDHPCLLTAAFSPQHPTSSPGQIYPDTPNLNQDAYFVYQTKPLCLPNFIPSKPFVHSRPTLQHILSSASTCFVYVRHRTNNNNNNNIAHVQLLSQKCKPYEISLKCLPSKTPAM